MPIHALRKSLLRTPRLPQIVELPPGGFVFFPTCRGRGAMSGSQTLNSALGKAAAVFRAPRAGTIVGVDFRTGTVTVAPAGGLIVSLRDVDLATGNPDGTDDQSVVVPATITANTWYSSTFGTGRTVARGDLIAVLIGINSFTAGENLQIVQSTSGEQGRPAFDVRPYRASADAAGTWIKTVSAPAFAIRYDDTYGRAFPAWSFLSSNQLTLNTGSSPDEAGNVFSLDWPVRCIGGWFSWDITGSATGDFQIVLYDAAGTALRTADHDGDTPPDLFYTRGVLWPAIDLVPYATYRVVVKPKTGTNTGMTMDTYGSSAQRESSPWGPRWQRTHRVDAGAWTDTSTQIAYVGLTLSGLGTSGLGTR